ncbi:co-chaperone GroES [bacterium]|nr:co-chaperone GroES [bacterium]MBT02199.1 co-chaperone GroES [bacterium]|tara:strand:- start:20506 stop:20805 length:300 start_codon:yes stop_codon:yes gene_type:complete
MKLAPLGDRVIVKRLDAESSSPSGIVIADSAKERPQKGTVVAVGPGKKEANLNGQMLVQPMNLKVGDTVVFSKYGGNELSHEGEEYLILREDDILAQIK